jgi:hypothetical protein
VRFEQQTHDETPTSGDYIAPVVHGWSALASIPSDSGIQYLTTNLVWQNEGSPDPTNARQWKWNPPQGAQSSAVTDSTRVHNFWIGTETLSYVDANNKTILVRTEDWSEACGQALCDGGGVSSYLYSNPYRVFHPVHPKRSATSLLQNTQAACAGQAGTTANAPLRLSGCRYAGTWSTCTIGSGDSEYLDRFYCGDLLWAIENGPCRTTVGTITIGGNEAGTLSANRYICFNDETQPDGDGKCHPAEATVSINNLIPVSARFQDAPYLPSYLQQIGTLNGDYVCQWQKPQGSNSSCLMQDYYSPPITFSYNGSSYYLRLLVKRRRQDWTGDRGSQFGEVIGTPCLPWNSGQASSLGGTAEIDGSAQTLAGAAISFSAAQDPLPKTITADTAQIAPEGQTVTYTYCCDNVYQAQQNQQPVLVPQTTPQATTFTKTYPANNTLGSIFWLVWKSNTVMELEQPPRGCVFEDWKLLGDKPCGACPPAILSLPSGYSASGDTITVPWAWHHTVYDEENYEYVPVDDVISLQRAITSPLYPTPACALQPTTTASWITPSIYIINTGAITLTIQKNTTGQQRTGTVTVPCGTSGASTWTVVQNPQ